MDQVEMRDADFSVDKLSTRHIQSTGWCPLALRELTRSVCCCCCFLVVPIGFHRIWCLLTTVDMFAYRCTGLLS